MEVLEEVLAWRTRFHNSALFFRKVLAEKLLDGDKITIACSVVRHMAKLKLDGNEARKK